MINTLDNINNLETMESFNTEITNSNTEDSSISNTTSSIETYSRSYSYDYDYYTESPVTSWKTFRNLEEHEQKCAQDAARKPLIKIIKEYALYFGGYGLLQLLFAIVLVIMTLLSDYPNCRPNKCTFSYGFNTDNNINTNNSFHTFCNMTVNNYTFNVTDTISRGIYCNNNTASQLAISGSKNLGDYSTYSIDCYSGDNLRATGDYLPMKYRTDCRTGFANPGESPYMVAIFIISVLSAMFMFAQVACAYRLFTDTK